MNHELQVFDFLLEIQVLCLFIMNYATFAQDAWHRVQRLNGALKEVLSVARSWRSEEV